MYQALDYLHHWKRSSEFPCQEYHLIKRDEILFPVPQLGTLNTTSFQGCWDCSVSVGHTPQLGGGQKGAATVAPLGRTACLTTLRPAHLERARPCVGSGQEQASGVCSGTTMQSALKCLLEGFISQDNHPTSWGLRPLPIQPTSPHPPALCSIAMEYWTGQHPVLSSSLPGSFHFLPETWRESE